MSGDHPVEFAFASGNGGQKIVVVDALELVIVLTAPPMAWAVGSNAPTVEIDPNKSKGSTTQWGSADVDIRGKPGYTERIHYPIGKQDIYSSIPEQHYDNAKKFQRLPPAQFIYRRRNSDSGWMLKPYIITIDVKNRPAYMVRPDPALIVKTRQELLKRDSRWIDNVLFEIAARSARASQEAPAAPAQSSPIPVTTKGKFKRP